MKAVREWLDQFDWGALIGAALCLAFYLGVVGPVIINWTSLTHHSQQQQAEPTKDSDKDLEVAAPEGGDEALATYTLWLVVFTAILAVSTIGLWLVTAKTLRHAQDDARRQAEDSRRQHHHAMDAYLVSRRAANASVKASQAAELSATAAVQANLPALYIESVDSAFPDLVPMRAYLELYRPQIVVHNYGGTPAFVSEVYINVSVCAVLPPNPTYIRYATFPKSFCIDAKGSKTLSEGDFPGRTFFTEEMITALELRASDPKNAGVWLNLYGKIEYTDFLGKPHALGFAFYRVSTGDYVVDGTAEEYNYRT